jgi:hypothetical protein
MDMSAYFNPMAGAGPQTQFTPQSDQFSQIMLAFMTQNGVMDQATGMVDKAKFQKQLNDTQALQNQLDASQWSNLKQMADAWSR